MSRVGKHPILIPSGVTCEQKGDRFDIKGKQGALSFVVSKSVLAKFEEGKISVEPANNSKESRMLWGTTRNILSNMVKGVHEGFTVNLEIIGVGYRAAVQGDILKLQLGYSHDVDFPIPSDIKIVCEKPTSVAITGADKQRVGQIAAEIRSYRKPEPYKGKGIKLANEVIFRKEGKKK